MIKRIFLWGTSLAACSTAYAIHTDNLKIDVHNPALRKLISSLHEKNPKHAQRLFKKLVEYQLLQNKTALWSKKILGSGFDIQGRMIDGVKQLGFAGVQIGPISYQPTTKQNVENAHLGIHYARASISSFRRKQSLEGERNEQRKRFTIGINIVPDEEIAKFTPYIIQENIVNTVQGLGKSVDEIDFLTINMDSEELNPYISGIPSENPDFVRDIIVSCRKSLTQQKILNANKKESEKGQASAQPQLWLQIPLDQIKKYEKSQEINQFIVRTSNQLVKTGNSDRLFANSNIMYWDELIESILNFSD